MKYYSNIESACLIANELIDNEQKNVKAYLVDWLVN